MENLYILGKAKDNPSCLLGGGYLGGVVSLLRYLEAIYTNAAIYHSYFGYEEPAAVSEVEGK